MALDLKKRWSDSKKLYEQTVGKRKPSADFLAFITKRSTGVGSGLKAFDDAMERYTSDHKPASFAAMAKAGVAATKAMEEYEKLLAARTKADKLTDPAYTKGLDMLRKDLDAISASITSTVRQIRLDEELVNSNLNKPHQEIIAAANAHQAKRWKSDASGYIKDLAAGLAKVRAKPDATTFAAALRPALRDIGNVMCISNMKQIGIENLTKSSDYPGKAIDLLAQLDKSPDQPKSPEDVSKLLTVIGPRATVVATWFSKVARQIS